jgi:hypothetical protein
MKPTSPQPCFNMMHDGRSFTDYRPRCTIQYQMKLRNGDNASSYEARQYMIQNATTLMGKNQSIAEMSSGCTDCFDKLDPGTMLPERNVQECNARTCTFQTDKTPKGLGLGRKY